MRAIAALYGDVTTAEESEVPVFARPAVAPGRSVGRDQYGRPLIVPPGEETPVPYTRASSEAGYLTDGNALRVWQTRRLAVALSRFPDLLMRVAVLQPDPDKQVLEFGDAKAELARAKADRADLDDLITRALDRDGTLGKADWGTAMHKLSEPTTPRDNVPEALVPDLKAYDQALADRGIVRVESEVFCVNDRFRIAGTTDGVFDVPGWGRVVGDLKTGQLHPVQHAVQLAAYAGADRFNPDAPEGQQRTPLDVRQDVGLLIHALKGTGTCELFLIDLKHGRRAIGLAEQVRDARRSSGLARPFDEVDPFPDYSAVPQRVMLSVDPDEPDLQPLVEFVDRLGPRLQRQAAEGRARRDAARAQAVANPEAPVGAKVRTAADVRADAEAAGETLGTATVERLQQAAQHRELAAGHPGVDDLKLPTTDQQASAGPSSSPGESAAQAVPQPPPARPGGPQQATPRFRSELGPVPAGTPLGTDGRPLDVNGNPVDVQHDGFDDLRVSDPLPVAEDTSAARGLVTNVLGGRELTLAERIATATNRDEVNALFREFSALGQWGDEHHRLAQQRVALLGNPGQ